MAARECVYVCALLLLTLGLGLGLFGEKMSEGIAAGVQQRIRTQVVWQEDSSPDVSVRFLNDTHEGAPPVHVSFYFFNITNLAEVRGGHKPILQEVGPYTYRKHRVKRDVRFVENGTRVEFQDYSFHLHLPHLTNGSLDDPITTLNIPLVGALESIHQLRFGQAHLVLDLLAALVEGWGDSRVRGLFTTRPVRELLWGYEDPLLARVARWLPSVTPSFALVHNSSSPEDTHGRTVVNTGADDLSKVWDYEVWENVTQVSSWAPGHTEQVHGTDALQFRPGLALGDKVEAWVGELYRAAGLVAAEQVTEGGVSLLRFRADPAQAEPDSRYYQYVKGLMNITSPTAAGPAGPPGRAGPPLFLSYPHYCGADPALAAGVEGVVCDPERHDLFLDVEPNTGITLRAAKRLMLSSWFGRRWRGVDPGVADSTFLPVFWAGEASQASGQQLRRFAPMLRARSLVLLLQTYAKPVGLTCGVLAGVLLLGAAAEQAWHARSSSSSSSSASEQRRVAGGSESGLEEGLLSPAPSEAVAEGEAEGSPAALAAAAGAEGSSTAVRQPSLRSHPAGEIQPGSLG